MIKILPESERDLLVVKVTAKLTDSDFDIYRDAVRMRIEQFGYVRLYFEMEAFEGWEISSFLENGLFDLVHGQKFGRVAMVGERQWQEIAARVASLVKRKGIKYFELGDREIALLWVKADPDKPI
ncbi:STAS/SEC14 domain-containing protein [Pedobacter sp. SYSU D00535]|uniref:STAS/SEC14 domain-containing protein n=1 Tax=Pedobacter sp. SYSU D00535 TaxID=2810308 RepID=UPI001A95EE74|nr:STAS/SEC14 domain-containing protein [Pedobacter sp. SYSU D00535]